METSKSAFRSQLLVGKHERQHKEVIVGKIPDGSSDGYRFQSYEASQSVRESDLRSNRKLSTEYQPGMRTLKTYRYEPSQPLYYGLLAMLVCLFITPVTAAFINFQNCLSQAYQDNHPTALQFVPLFMDASFNTTDPSHKLSVTVWGNVTGAYYKDTQLPSPNDPAWTNPNFTDGKIENLPSPHTKWTTLSRKVNFLNYESWKQSDKFCDVLVNGTCPLAPRFTANASIPYDFPSFNLTNDFYSSYAFTSLTVTFLIIDGDATNLSIGCVSGEITPDLGSGLSGILTFLPLVVLVAVGFATAFAGVFSPCGSSDTFRWTSNYGRDADLLRLVTPGFGDCLQYIQFIVLTGGLTLSYPGYYQPVVSKVSWSALMFNESFVSRGNGSKSLTDGIYAVNGTYGLDNLSQLVGMTQVDDIWAGMAVWLLVILGTFMAIIQIAFLLRWAYRHLSDIQEEDLRAKNMPFSVGNVIRLVFSYFLLPIVALSMFQLVVASSSPPYTVALAVVMLLVVVGFAVWLLYIIATTRPRSFLFDDLPTVLLYGPLYNTYSDDAAAFALVPVLLTFIRGVAIGAVQPSGIAQIVLLAICEIVFILTLHSFRPFHSPTSMNAYHTLFAAARLTSVLLMVAFAPSLGVTDGPKGWIGYSILLLHGVVLVFGFLLNALQTTVEVVARMAGAGGDETGVTRGGLVKVFGMRQLSRRLPRGGAASRQSQLSTTAMLDPERKSTTVNGGRERSQSEGSAGVLLTRPRSIGHESNGIDMVGGSAYTPTTPGEASAFSFNPSASGQAGADKARGRILSLGTAETADPYYRPPRLRRPTMEATYSPGARSRGSWASGDWANKRWSNREAGSGTPSEDPAEPLGPSISGRGTPIPGFSGSQPQRADSNIHESRRTQTDYTIREVDFYYGVRGPALNANVPNRRLKTGPVDPTGPASNAAGWFNRLLGGKTKEKGKGFEVVRSSRMPPGMKRPDMGADSPPEDVPEGIPVATQGEARNGPIDSDDDEPVHKKKGNVEELIPINDDSELDSEADASGANFEMTRISDIPPSLPGIDIGGDIELPSRFPSKAGSSLREGEHYVPPSVPRKNPRRMSQGTGIPLAESRQRPSSDLYDPDPRSVQRLPHPSTGSTRLPFDGTNSRWHSTVSARSSLTGFEEPGRSNQSSLIDDSPTIVGPVSHHSLWTVTDHVPSIDLLGSSAEIVNLRPIDSRQNSHDKTTR